MTRKQFLAITAMLFALLRAEADIIKTSYDNTGAATTTREGRRNVDMASIIILPSGAFEVGRSARDIKTFHIIKSNDILYMRFCDDIGRLVASKKLENARMLLSGHITWEAITRGSGQGGSGAVKSNFELIPCEDEDLALVLTMVNDVEEYFGLYHDKSTQTLKYSFHKAKPTEQTKK